MYEPRGSRRRSWTTYPGSNCSTTHCEILVLLMDIASCQHYRGGIPEVVNLRMAPGTQFLQSLPDHRLAFDSYGYCLGLSCASLDALRLQSTRGQLELRLPATEVLGAWYTGAELYTGRLQHHHRCGIYGGAAYLLVQGAAVEKDAVGHPHRLSPLDTVSLPDCYHIIRTSLSVGVRN
jgi:hypothetical protein